MGEVIDEPDGAKVERYRQAVQAFVERLRSDPTVLACIQVGSLTEETVWRRDGISLWIIEQDGVTRRLRADGDGERVFRTFVEQDVLLWAELISRGRFKRMVDGASRTVFNFNHFAARTLIYCTDPALESWFAQANESAARDRDHEKLVLTTWLIWAQRHAHRLLKVRQELRLACEAILEAAHAIAHLEVVREGTVSEGIVIQRGMELAPALMKTVYVEPLTAPSDRGVLEAALEAIEVYLDEHAEEFLKPLLRWLRTQQHPVPWSELADRFAHSQLHPWHLETACEWLVRRGEAQRWSSPFAITKKSRTEVEEPAWMLDEPA